MCQDSNGCIKYIIKLKFYYDIYIYIRIMNCKLWCLKVYVEKNFKVNQNQKLSICSLIYLIDRL